MSVKINIKAIINTVINAYWPFKLISKQDYTVLKPYINGHFLLENNVKRLFGFLPFYFVFLCCSLVSNILSDVDQTIKPTISFILVFLILFSALAFFFILYNMVNGWHKSRFTLKHYKVMFYSWWWINSIAYLYYAFVQLDYNYEALPFLLLAFVSFSIPISNETGLIRRVLVAILTLILLYMDTNSTRLVSFLFMNESDLRRAFIFTCTFLVIICSLLQILSYRMYSVHAYLYLTINNDSLTGCKNRKGAQEYVNILTDHRIATSGVIMIDIDHFKLYNDCLGHDAGDECLKGVAHAISAVSQRNRCTPIRHGGEEFVVMCSHASSAEETYKIAQEIAEEIYDSRFPAPIETGHAFVTVSMGVSFEELHHGCPYETYVANADKALYESKNTGRNKITIYHDDL